MKAYRNGIILSIGSILVTLLFIEIVLRIFPPSIASMNVEETWKAQITNIAENKFRVGIRIENYAFWEDPLKREVLDRDFTRILFLGDSFTFGEGLLDPSRRFTDVLETKLNESAEINDSPRRFHVFNAGIPGSVPSDWHDYLKEIEPAYHPNIVIAVFFLRDGTSLPTSLKYNEDLVNQLLAPHKKKPLYRVSMIARIRAHQRVWNTYREHFRSRLKASYLGTNKEKETWEIQKVHLLEIKRYCEDRDIDFRCVVFPILMNLNDYEFHDVEEEILRFFNTQNIPSFSLTPGFIGRDEKGLWLASNDQHPNEKGHSIAAETLWPYLKRTLEEREEQQLK